MTGRLIVANAAGTDDLGVIHLAGLHNPVDPGGSQMTGLTQVGHTDVACRKTVATGSGATSKYLVVINTGAGPARETRGIMAGLTVLAGRNMGGGFDVTRRTETDDLIVIYGVGRNNPVDTCRNQMTGLAQVGHLDVSARQGMATRAGAGTIDLIMIDAGRYPDRKLSRVMTGITDL